MWIVEQRARRVAGPVAGCGLVLFLAVTAMAREPAPSATTQRTLVPLKIERGRGPWHVTKYQPDPARGEPEAERPPDPNKTPLMVPRGTANLAKGKSVTLSCKAEIGEANQVTDGSKFTTDGEQVEVGEGPQWVQVDLGEAATIHAVALWRWYADERVYFDTIIQVCDSEKFEKDVRTVFNNSLKGLKGVADKGKDRLYVETENGRVVPVDGVRGRYVRVWSNGSTSDRRNHVIELEVLGVREE